MLAGLISRMLEGLPTGLLGCMHFSVAWSIEIWHFKFMMIATANSKGGVGKTTIAVHLAAWFHEHGYSVTLVDCDPQRSSSEWISEACPEVTTICMSNSDQVMTELPLLRGSCDCIVVDGPAGLDEISRAILVHVDGVVVPCKAGTLEARALLRATKAIKQVQQIPGREGLPEATIVLTMVGERFLLTREMQEAASALSYPVASSMLRQRQVYAHAPGQGTILWRMGKKAAKAALEMDTFFQELLPGIETQSPSRIEKLVSASARKLKPRVPAIEPMKAVANG